MRRQPDGRLVFRTVGSVSSFGASPMEQHIGIGMATMVDEVRIVWPADPKHAQVLRGLAVDRAFRVREGKAEAEEIPRKAFTLGGHALHPDALMQAMP